MAKLIWKGKLRVHHLSARLPRKIAKLMENRSGLHNYFLAREEKFYRFNLFKPYCVTESGVRVAKDISINWERGVVYFKAKLGILRELEIKKSRKEDSFVEVEVYEDGEVRFIKKRHFEGVSKYF